MTFAPVVPCRPGQVDDLGPGRQPGLRAGRVPQRVQPGVEDFGQRARVPGQPGQPERLVGQGPPPHRGRGVTEQFAGQPGQHPGPGGVVPSPFGRHLEQPDQVRVHVEERRGRRRPQGQVDDGVLGGGEPGQLSRQRQGRPRQAARRHPQRPPRSRLAHRFRPRFAGCADQYRLGEIRLAQPGQPQLARQPQRRGRGGDHRGAGGRAPRGHHREHGGGLEPATVQVVDHDQSRACRRKVPGRAVQVQRPRLRAEQYSRQLVRPARVAKQLRPDQASRLARGRRAPEHLEPAPPRLTRRRLRQRSLARPRGAHEGEQAPRTALRAVQQPPSLPQLTPPTDDRHTPDIPRPAPGGPLGVIFPGRTSAPIGRTGQNGASLNTQVTALRSAVADHAHRPELGARARWLRGPAHATGLAWGG